MKKILSIAAFAIGVFFAGCATLDVASEGNADRVLDGTVRPPVTLPAGAEVVVQLVDTAPSAPPTSPANDLPIANRAPVPALRILGEYRQILPTPTIEPVPFRIEYHAGDDQLRHGLNIDVRVSVGGRIRFRTINAYMLTLASSPFPQEVPVQALE